MPRSSHNARCCGRSRTSTVPYTRVRRPGHAVGVIRHIAGRMPELRAAEWLRYVPPGRQDACVTCGCLRYVPPGRQDACATCGRMPALRADGCAARLPVTSGCLFCSQCSQRLPRRNRPRPGDTGTTPFHDTARAVSAGAGPLRANHAWPLRGKRPPEPCLIRFRHAKAFPGHDDFAAAPQSRGNLSRHPRPAI